MTAHGILFLLAKGPFLVGAPFELPLLPSELVDLSVYTSPAFLIELE